MPRRRSTKMNIVFWGFDPKTGAIHYGLSRMKEKPVLFLQAPLYEGSSHPEDVLKKLGVEDDERMLLFEAGPLGPWSTTGWLARPAYAYAQVDISRWRELAVKKQVPPLDFMTFEDLEDRGGMNTLTGRTNLEFLGALMLVGKYPPITR